MAYQERIRFGGRYQEQSRRAEAAVATIRAMNESWRQSQDARTQFPDPKQRPSFSALDRPNDPETTKEMTDFYKSLDRHNLGHKINTIATGGFFIEGGRRYNKGKSAFGGMQEAAMSSISDYSNQEEYPYALPAGSETLPGSVQPLSSDQLADAHILYIDNILMKGVKGGIRALNRFDDTVAGTAFTHTLFEHGPLGGADILADTVQRTMQEIAERGPKDQKFLPELIKIKGEMIPVKTTEVPGPTGGSYSMNLQQKNSKIYDGTYRSLQAQNAMQSIFDNFVALANSRYRNILLETLANRRTLPKGSLYDVNPYATDAPNHHSIVK